MSYTPFVDLLVSLLSPHPQASMDTTHTSSTSVSVAQTSERASSGSLASTSHPSTSSPERHRRFPGSAGAAAAAAVHAGGYDQQPRASATTGVAGDQPRTAAATAEAARAARSGVGKHPRAAAAARGGDGVRAGGTGVQPSPWQALFGLHQHSLAYRACFLAALEGEDTQLCCAAVRVLVAVLHSKVVSPHVLSAAGQSCCLALRVPCDIVG